jgi:hypothetical protein
MFLERHVQYFMGKSKRLFRLAKSQREGARIQGEGADKLEALGRELEAKAVEIKSEIQQDRRR